jgi:hypothetical protein
MTLMKVPGHLGTGRRGLGPASAPGHRGRGRGMRPVAGKGGTPCRVRPPQGGRASIFTTARR